MVCIWGAGGFKLTVMVFIRLTKLMSTAIAIRISITTVWWIPQLTVHVCLHLFLCLLIYIQLRLRLCLEYPYFLIKSVCPVDIDGITPEGLYVQFTVELKFSYKLFA